VFAVSAISTSTEWPVPVPVPVVLGAELLVPPFWPAMNAKTRVEAYPDVRVNAYEPVPVFRIWTTVVVWWVTATGT